MNENPWSALGLPPLAAAVMARQDEAERIQAERQEIDRAIERQDRRQELARAEARWELQHGYTRAELLAHMGEVEAAREARDTGAEYGSRSRPAVLFGGELIRAREEVAPVRVSETDRLLDRARAADADGYMARMCREFDDRQAARRNQERQAEISRTEQVLSGLGY
jgi:hypothetical protein